jgi:hypothetical protein
MDAIKSLFTSFDTMITPKLMVIVYWIGLVLIALSALSGFLPALFGGSFGWALLTLVGGALGILLWRVSCELMIVVFKIHDRLGTINEGLKTASSRD